MEAAVTDATNYHTCLYCGKVLGYANPGLPDYCNYGCRFAERDGPPVTREQWQHNFDTSLVEFNEKRQKRFSRLKPEVRDRR